MYGSYIGVAPLRYTYANEGVVCSCSRLAKALAASSSDVPVLGSHEIFSTLLCLPYIDHLVRNDLGLYILNMIQTGSLLLEPELLVRIAWLKASQES